jgi:hypothetical protein
MIAFSESLFYTKSVLNTLYHDDQIEPRLQMISENSSANATGAFNSGRGCVALGA